MFFVFPSCGLWLSRLGVFPTVLVGVWCFLVLLVVLVLFCFVFFWFCSVLFCFVVLCFLFGGYFLFGAASSGVGAGEYQVVVLFLFVVLLFCCTPRTVVRMPL